MPFPRFYPILDTAALGRHGLPALSAAEALLEAGVRILQFRHKGHYGRSVFADAEAIAAACRQAGCTLVVNDRADIAALLDAGLHVGQDDLPPGHARRVNGARMLGFSTHNEAQFRAALHEPIDYIAFGPIFETASKENPDPVVGLGQLRVLRELTDRPLVAIGGITLANVAEAFAAGTDSVAVIGGLFAGGSGRDAVRRSAEEWLRR